jgi:hypothetical protein
MDDSASDLKLLSDEFKFTGFSTAVAAWRAAHPSQDADTRLIPASLDEQLQSQTRAIRLLEEKVEGQKCDILALEGKIGDLREAIAASGAKLKEDLRSIEREVKDCQRQSQE